MIADAEPECSLCRRTSKTVGSVGYKVMIEGVEWTGSGRSAKE